MHHPTYSSKKILLLVILFNVVVVFINGHVVPPALPEELLTDNDEQLDRLKRENFLESILKHIPFLHMSEPRSIEEDEERPGGIQSEEPGNPKADINESSPALTESISVSLPSSSGILFPSSITSSSSTNALSSSTASPSLFDANIFASSSSINVTTPLTFLFASLSSTQVLNNASIAATLITVDIDQITTTLIGNISSSINMSSRVSNQSAIDSVIDFITIPVQMTSTSNLIGLQLSSISSASPTVPTPPLSSSFSNSVSSSSSVSSTSFAALSTQSIAMALSSSAYESFAEPAVTLIVESVEPSESQNGKVMPVLPNEKGFANTGTREVLEEEKVRSIGFVYTNIILPIVSGITGALLITFGIMLFRCCRRRKLKKVRYYGGRPNSDFVRLDRMNLLTDSSDDDY